MPYFIFQGHRYRYSQAGSPMAPWWQGAEEGQEDPSGRGACSRRCQVQDDHQGYCDEGLWQGEWLKNLSFTSQLEHYLHTWCEHVLDII